MQSSPQASSVHMQHLQSITVAFLYNYVELSSLENRMLILMLCWTISSIKQRKDHTPHREIGLCTYICKLSNNAAVCPSVSLCEKAPSTTQRVNTTSNSLSRSSTLTLYQPCTTMERCCASFSIASYHCVQRCSCHKISWRCAAES